MKTKFFMMIAALFLLSFSSCKKQSFLPEQTNLDLADDDAVSEAVFEDIFNSIDIATAILDDALKNGDIKSLTLLGDSCPSITLTQPSEGIWPKTVTIDYGSGCTGFYENSRSGRIIIEVTGPRREEGSKRTVTFDNYYFNNIKVEGTKVYENLGLNSAGNFVIAVTLENGKLILPDGISIERTIDHQREWIAGFMTPDRWDDECLISGTASGKNADRISYSSVITSPLHWKRVCQFIVSGIVTLTKEGSEPFKLDYGDGECDNKATVSRGNESKEILLHHRFRSWLH
jgi:hypothetical protein